MTDLLQRIQNAKDTAPRGKRLAKILCSRAIFESDDIRGNMLVAQDDTLPDDSMEFVYEDALDTSSTPETIY